MDAGNTYVEIVVYLGSDCLVIGKIIIPKHHQYIRTLNPIKGMKVQVEAVRIPWIHLSLVRDLNSAFRRDI